MCRVCVGAAWLGCRRGCQHLSEPCQAASDSGHVGTAQRGRSTAGVRATEPVSGFHQVGSLASHHATPTWGAKGALSACQVICPMLGFILHKICCLFIYFLSLESCSVQCLFVCHATVPYAGMLTQLCLNEGSILPAVHGFNCIILMDLIVMP